MRCYGSSGDKIRILFLSLISFLILLIQANLVEATTFSESLSDTLQTSDSITLSSPKFHFDFGIHANADGMAVPAGFTPVPVLITYDDQANPKWHDNKADMIQITVKSIGTSESKPLSLVEIDPSCINVDCPRTPNTGFFRNNNLVFMDGDNFFPMNAAVKISITNTPNAGNPLPITVVSNSSLARNDPGLSFNLNETSPGRYNGSISFTSGVSSSTRVHAVPGDVITVTDQVSGVASNALITPNPRGDLAALHVNHDDTVTASYGDLIATTTVQAQGGIGGGGGGGGIVTQAGLVLDFLIQSSQEIGGGAPASPPSFGIDAYLLQGSPLPSNIKEIILHPDSTKPIPPITNSTVDLPLTIDGNGFILPLHANTIVTNTEQTGSLINLKVILHDSYDVTHLSLFTNLRGSARDIADSDTAIIYEKGKPVQIVDPHGFFSNVKVTESGNGNRYEFDYDITFAKAMDKSDIIFRSWTDRLASTDVDIFDAWKVVQNQIPSNSSNLIPAQQVAVKPTQQAKESSGDLMGAINDWGGYSPNPISDSEFLGKIGIKGQHIPNWVLKTTKWILNGGITEDDFVKTIKYLYSTNIIK